MIYLYDHVMYKSKDTGGMMGFSTAELSLICLIQSNQLISFCFNKASAIPHISRFDNYLF